MREADRLPLSARRRRTNDQVVAALTEHGTLTREEVGRLTGLSRSAVASAVSSLVTEGLVALEGAATSTGAGPGRRPERIGLRRHPGVVLGLDFGHAHVTVAVASTSGEVLTESTAPVDVEGHPHRALDAATRLAEECLATAGRSRAEVVGIAAGIPGPLDTRTRVVRAPTSLGEWVGLSPEEELSRRFGRPVAVANDAQMGAIGEAAFGAARDVLDFIYLKASHGIGAGLMLAGRPYSGSVGISGEIGHTRVPGADQLCRCGNRGCLETVVSVDRVLAELAHVSPERGAGLLPDVTELLSQPAAARVLVDAGRTVGHVLADVVNCLNPAAIIVGGELSVAGDPLAAGIRESIDRYAQPISARAVTVMTSSLDHRAELLGAVARAIEQARVAPATILGPLR